MTITIHEKATATAKGTKKNGNCKPVLCIDTGEVFSSVMDAANHFEVTLSSMSCAITGKTKTCKGKQFCFVSKVSEHMDEITKRIRANAELVDKAARWDALIAEKEASRKALSDAEALVNRKTAEYEKMLAKARETLAELQNARENLADLQDRADGIALSA